MGVFSGPYYECQPLDTSGQRWGETTPHRPYEVATQQPNSTIDERSISW